MAGEKQKQSNGAQVVKTKRKRAFYAFSASAKYFPAFVDIDREDMEVSLSRWAHAFIISSWFKYIVQVHICRISNYFVSLAKLTTSDTILFSYPYTPGKLPTLLVTFFFSRLE